MVDINALLADEVAKQRMDRARRDAKAQAEPRVMAGRVNYVNNGPGPRVVIPPGMHYQVLPWHRVDLPQQEDRIPGIAPGEVQVVDNLDEFLGPPEWGVKAVVQEGDEVMPGPAEFRTRSERSTRLPRFKLKYDTAEECNLRLNGTVITVQDQVIYIQKVSNIKQDGHRGLGVIGYNRDGQLVSLLLDPNGLNLRTLEPGYIQAGGHAYLFRRKPARVYKQGLNQENTVFTKVGSGQRTPLFGGLRTPDLVKAFEDRPVMQWDPSFFDDDPEGRVQSKRLSDRIAVYRKNKNLKVEHRGYDLGFLREGTVYTEVDNVWVNRALEAVGLKISLIK